MLTDYQKEDAYQRSLSPEKRLEYWHAVREGMHRHPKCRCAECQHFCVMPAGWRPYDLEAPVCALAASNVSPADVYFDGAECKEFELFDPQRMDKSPSDWEWHGCRVLFRVMDTWFVSGMLLTAEPPFMMGGFIERTSADLELDDDEDAFTETERHACEEAVVRFFEEGYIVKERQFQDFDMRCILDGEKYPLLDAYSTMGRNPVSPEDVWRFYHAPADEDCCVDE